MNKEESYALIIAFIIAITIFIGSSIVFPSLQGIGGLNLKSTTYHFSIYFFLCAFFLLALSPKGNLSNNVLVVVLSFLYAASDEIHQLFTPGRSFSYWDIFVDLFGILLAALLYSIFRLWQKQKA
ncbi:VanZ family protein [Candidatus Pacearchaeota archaeon]|nr:hypothetical protein [uncultured archaeon]MBS3066529.1 VanZ family protein [Candidatus Pacearchaeota archaeon]